MTTPADRLAAERDHIGPVAFTAASYRPGEVVHIVLFRLKPSVSDTERDEVVRRFLALGQACLRDGQPYIREIVAGRPNGGEGAERGFELGFVLRFASEGDRNYYCGGPIVTDAALCDPAHDAFKHFVGPLLADATGVLVFDFAAEKPVSDP